MLRVTVEWVPGGRETGKRTLAIAEIGNVSGGAEPNYEIRLEEDGRPAGSGVLRGYPRWSSSIWDLVARSIAQALTGAEALPPRPTLVQVPIRTSGNVSYVCLSDIPEPARTEFKQRMDGSTAPLVEEAPEPWNCAYAWDWTDFLRGRR